MSEKGTVLEVLLAEYSCLTSEQAQRIGFRDNLLYVTLGVFGTVVSFALSDPGHYYGLLVIPWVCVILGWEVTHRDDKHRRRRKIQQLMVDEITLDWPYWGNK
jgi:hypothetical protein